MCECLCIFTFKTLKKDSSQHPLNQQKCLFLSNISCQVESEKSELNHGNFNLPSSKPQKICIHGFIPLVSFRCFPAAPLSTSMAGQCGAGVPAPRMAKAQRLVALETTGMRVKKGVCKGIWIVYEDDEDDDDEDDYEYEHKLIVRTNMRINMLNLNKKMNITRPSILESIFPKNLNRSDFIQCSEQRMQNLPSCCSWCSFQNHQDLF